MTCLLNQPSFYLTAIISPPYLPSLMTNDLNDSFITNVRFKLHDLYLNGPPQLHLLMVKITMGPTYLLLSKPLQSIYYMQILKFLSYSRSHFIYIVVSMDSIFFWTFAAILLRLLRRKKGRLMVPFSKKFINKRIW